VFGRYPAKPLGGTLSPLRVKAASAMFSEPRTDPTGSVPFLDQRGSAQILTPFDGHQEETRQTVDLLGVRSGEWMLD
jgi:hypothetical protein